MKAIILVGGEGTRLRPLTYTTPKAMVPIINVPFIQHVTTHLKSHNINELILSMGYKPDKIKKYFDENPASEVNIIYNIEDIPLGTAGAVKFAQRHIQDSECFFVMNGDIFTDIDLSAMLDFHKKKKASVTIALEPVEDPSQFGVVELDSHKRIKRFIEKPKKEEAPSNLINAGFYILEPEIMEYIPENKFFMFERDVFPRLIAEKKPVFGYVTDAYWIDVGTPDKYLRLNADLLTGKCSSIKRLELKMTIPEGSKINATAKSEGPVLMGKNCRVEKNVVIIGPTVLGSNCILGQGSQIENSILWSGVHIGKNAKIKGCIIAENNLIDENTNLENKVINKLE